MAPAAVRETHVSTLFFVGDRVYKVKKPVALDFVDFSDASERERICRREVELNRRLAPDVYLGVAELRGPDGGLCDHMVVMRRMPEDRRLSALVSADADASPCVREVARVVAAFHARADRSPQIDAAASIDGIRRNWESSFATMEPFVGSVLDAEMMTRVIQRARRYTEGRAALFASRIEAGAVCDGHGDLLADDIFCLDDGPRILDCLEFDDDLRYGDVLADVAFLAMDLERLGALGYARRFLDWYFEFSGCAHPMTLVHHYIAYRALVRSKVACMRATQGDPSAVETARLHLALADEHLRSGRVMLALVGGLPGTGKSTLSVELSNRLGWAVLHSDETRKDLVGLGHGVHRGDEYGEGLYEPANTAATYETLMERARSLLGKGEPVILDASWGSTRWRDQARSAADAASAGFLEFRCDAPAPVPRLRLVARAAVGADSSDASSAIAQRMEGDADIWPTAVTIDTSGSRASAVEQVLQHL